MSQAEDYIWIDRAEFEQLREHCIKMDNALRNIASEQWSRPRLIEFIRQVLGDEEPSDYAAIHYEGPYSF